MGFFQDPVTPYDNNIDTSSFVDKTMFYQSQFTNCTTALSMLASSNNLDAWSGVNLSGGSSAFTVVCIYICLVVYQYSRIMPFTFPSFYRFLVHNNTSYISIRSPNISLLKAWRIMRLPRTGCNQSPAKTYMTSQRLQRALSSSLIYHQQLLVHMRLFFGKW
jgi:hypothetical protein